MPARPQPNPSTIIKSESALAPSAINDSFVPGNAIKGPRPTMMLTRPSSDRRSKRLVLPLCLLLSMLCSKIECAAQPRTTHAGSVSSSDTSGPSAGAGLPMNFERRTGDLDAMVKRGQIRALVLYSRSGFFYVNGRPQGVYYEALREFEQFINQKLTTGKKHIQVSFIPLRPDE